MCSRSYIFANWLQANWLKNNVYFLEEITDVSYRSPDGSVRSNCRKIALTTALECHMMISIIIINLYGPIRIGPHKCMITCWLAESNTSDSELNATNQQISCSFLRTSCDGWVLYDDYLKNYKNIYFNRPKFWQPSLSKYTLVAVEGTTFGCLILLFPSRRLWNSHV